MPVRSYLEITIHGPNKDLHSGLFGGAVPNPINVLSSIIAAMHDSQRRITIPHFYDDVEETSPRVRQQWQKMGFDDNEFLGSVGLTESFGEVDRTTIERTWSRPTCDVNGIYGGYMGTGTDANA